MEEKDSKKDYKKIFKWDDEKPAEKETGRGERKKRLQETFPERKKSKKVLRREAKDMEKQIKKDVAAERRKSRLTKKGRIWIIAGAAAVLTGIILWTVFGYFGWGIDLTRALAKVDNVRVTEREVKTYIEFLENQNPDSVPDVNDSEYKDLQINILDSIIVLKLLEQYGEKNGFTVTQKEVDDEYAKIIANYASEEEFEKDLKDKKITKAFLMGELESQILRDKIYAKVTEGIMVSEEEIKKYYDESAETLFAVPEQVRVSHILVKFNVPEGEELTEAIKSEARSKITDIEKQLSEGADFTELAKKYSEDTASAPNGGDIGFISKGQTVAEFEEAAFALDIGQISSITETYYGYHLIKVTEKQAAYVKSYDEVKDTISSYLLNNRQTEVWQDFVYSLLDKANIIYGKSLKGQLLDITETTEGVTESTDTTDTVTTDTNTATTESMDAPDTAGSADTSGQQ